MANAIRWPKGVSVTADDRRLLKGVAAAPKMLLRAEK